MKRFWKDIKRYMPYAKYATKSGLKSEAGELTFELAMVDFGSYFIYAGILVYFHGDFRTEKRIFSYLCLCRSVHVESV